MRSVRPAAVLGVLLWGAPEAPHLEAGFHELTDCSVAGWNHRPGPDAAAADQKAIPLFRLPASKP